MTKPKGTRRIQPPDEVHSPGIGRRAPAKRLYFATQPHRCQGAAEVGLGGQCLACGADQGESCRRNG